MPMIEGVGDEVLVVVGVFFLLCLVLLAWFSTHTRDIPFFSLFVVVELSRQRNANNGDNSAQSGEEAVDGHQPEALPGETGDSGVEAVATNNNADTANEDVEDSASAAASRNNVLEYLMSQCASSESGAKHSDTPMPSSVSESEKRDLTEQTAEGPSPGQAEEEVTTIPPFDPQPELGEEVRRRRVAYFSGGSGQESCKEQKKDTAMLPDEAATEELMTRDTASRHTSSHKSDRSHPVPSSEGLASNKSDSQVVSSHGLVTASSLSAHSLERPSCTADSTTTESEASPPSCQKTQPPQASVSERSPGGVASSEGSPSNVKSASKVTGESPSGVIGPSEEGASASGAERERVRNSSAERSDTASQQIRVRLKYLNDTQRLVYSNPQETIGNFRRLHFSSELEDNKIIRFIFNGQDLRNDLSTLQAYNIADNSVVHCLITQSQQSEAPPGAGGVGQEEEVQMGAMLFPVFGVVLGLVWYLRFVYKQYFNAMSTVSLAGISFIYLLAFFSSLRNRRQPHQHLE